jgi:hypothetical protein
MNWAAFELPEVPLVDRTTHVIEVKHPEHEDVALVVCRIDFPAGKTLRELVAGRVADEMARLSGYTVLENADAEWVGVPAVEVCSRWRHDGKVIYQRQAHFAAGDAWTFFALSGPLASRAACDAWMEQIKRSLRLRDDG